MLEKKEKRKKKHVRMNSRGVFGLNAIQQFFVILLGVALLAYVIVIIMGSLQGSTILPYASGSIANETTNGTQNPFANQTGYILGIVNAANSPSGLSGFSLTFANATNQTLAATEKLYNISVPISQLSISSNGLLQNATAASNWSNLSIGYSYNYYSSSQLQSNSLLGNVSTGITGFFSAINPVYAILAVLVIILVLVVLVRVVQVPVREGQSLQL